MADLIIFYYFIGIMIGITGLVKCYLFYVRTNIEYIKYCLIFIFIFLYYMIISFIESYAIVYLREIEIEVIVRWMSNFSVKLLFLSIVILMNETNKVKYRRYINIFAIFISFIGFIIDLKTVMLDRKEI